VALVSDHLAAQRDLVVRSLQDHGAHYVRYPEYQHLAIHVSDAFDGEDYHCDHQLAEELLRGVVRRDLGATTLYPELWSEVDSELYRRLSGLWKRLGLDDPPDPDVYLLEVSPGDL
jgi:hypothetical protein